MQNSPQPSTSTLSADPNIKVNAAIQAGGGGGADTSHGLVFHLNLAMLLLFSLKSMQQADPGFQYYIWLEKPGYGKFDDIVFKYKKSGGKWVQICVQCKHGEEKVLDDGTKFVKTINSDDLLSGKNKHFALVEYIKSFSEVRDTIEECETFYVLLTNRTYVDEQDKNYPFLEREVYNDICKILLHGNAFKLKYNHDLHNQVVKQAKLDKINNTVLNKVTTASFCDKFLYICDDRNLEVELKAQLSQHCKENFEHTKNLQARLYYLVSQMYQHNMEPTQNDFIDEFNGKNIHYKFPQLHPDHTGRIEEINKIKDALECVKGNHILDLLITGMAGMRPNQLVLKYIEDNKQNYKHVIWINADSSFDLDSSFVDLATTCQLISSDSNDNMSNIMEAIYSYFSYATLFVFDNASKDLLSKNDNREYIYLPNNGQDKNNKFIVISQDQKWTTNHPHLTVTYNMQRSHQPSTKTVSNNLDIKGTSSASGDLNTELKAANQGVVQTSDVQATINQQGPVIQLQDDEDFQPSKLISRIECTNSNSSAPDNCPIVKSQRLSRNDCDEQLDKKLAKPHLAGGGGGADVSHGLVFHLALAILLLFSLRSMHQADPGFQYHIWLEKPGFGKFDDIVLRYKKSGKQWVQICVQCKHGEEKVLSNDTRFVKSINADDFLSGKIKSFALVEYIKSFCEVKEQIEDCETFYVLLTNRSYDCNQDSKYNFLQREGNMNPNHIFFPGNGFKIENNQELHKHLVKQTKLDKKNVGKLNIETTQNFFDKFFFICDNRNLEDELQAKLLHHCKGNEENRKNLQGRLYFLVSQMYQQKREPTQNDFIDEFNGRNIHYKIHTPHPQFTGRIHEINKIKDALENKKENHIFDLLVTGMAGMGKTQVVLKYIEDNKQNYKHVIWINAESCVELENSFVELAKTCQLIDADSNNKMSDVVEAIYSYFCNDSLFVFDNASKNLLTTKDNCQYIYLPSTGQAKNNKFVVISQDQKWTTNNSHVIVNKFSEVEALQYLDASIDCAREEKLNLAASVQFWPLALCLAVSYIRLKSNKTLGEKCVFDVIQLFENDAEKLHKHLPEAYEMEPYCENLRKLWEILQTKLQSNSGELAIKILHILAFSYPDNFPVDLLKLDCYEKAKVIQSILLLVDLSILTIGQNEVSIHRTLQSVIRTSVTSDNNLYNEVLLLGTSSFEGYMKTLNAYESIKTVGNIHLFTFLQHVFNSQIEIQAYVDITERILTKITKSSDFLIYGRNVLIFDKIISKIKTKLGENCLEYIKIEKAKALALDKMGNYDEALRVYNHVINLSTEKLGKDHPDTVTCMNNKALVLNMLGKYEEALSTYNHVIEVRTEKLGKDHPDTLTCMHNKASVLDDIGKYDEALSIYNHVIQVETETLGADHSSTITSMHNKAYMLDKMGKYEEALSILNYVIEVETDKLGKDHPDTVITMHSKASVLDNMGKHDEALSIYNNVLEVLTQTLGDDHPDTVTCMHNKAVVLDKMGKYDEALNIYNLVIEVNSKKLGEGHPSTITNLHSKASVVCSMGKYDEALSIYNHVIEVITETLGKDHPSTITSMHSKASVLNDMGKYDEALRIFNQVIEVKTEKLGKDHPSTIISIHSKAKVLNEMGKYDDALSIYDSVIEVDTEMLGKNHPDTVTCLHNKALVLGNMGKYDEALSICNHVIEVRTEILGEKHPDTVTSMHNKAVVLHKMGKYDEALSICNQVIEVRTEIFGKDHPSTVTSMHSKALVLGNLGQFDEALSIYNYVIQVRTEKLGKDHPDTVTSFYNKSALEKKVFK